MSVAERFEVKPMKVNSTDTRIALLEQSHRYIQEALSRIERHFEKNDESFSKIESSFEKVYQKIDANNKWFIGIAISVLFSAATIGFKIYDLVHQIT